MTEVYNSTEKEIALKVRQKLGEIAKIAISARRNWASDLLAGDPDAVVAEVQKLLARRVEDLIIAGLGLRRTRSKGEWVFSEDPFAARTTWSEVSKAITQIAKTHVEFVVKNTLEKMKADGRYAKMMEATEETFIKTFQIEMERAARDAAEQAAHSVQGSFKRSLRDLIEAEVDSCFRNSNGLVELAKET
jgi:hypothetical protein